MANRLSVCLLTRNEEHNIARAIRSVAGAADEVVVAESGSTDRTAEIARELGAKLVAFAWDDDFAAGRNAALAQASGDWILWLNPDEELLGPGREAMRTLLAAVDDTFGYLARLQDVQDPDRPDRFCETWDLRLYRRRPDLRYIGRVHPEFTPDLAEAVAAEGSQVSRSEVVIRRHAYTSVLNEGKLRWAVRLLRRELEDRPGRLHSLIEYGRNLLLLNDPKGHEVMAEAIEQVVPHVEGAVPPSPDVQVLLVYVLTTTTERYRGRISRAEAMALGLRWFPNSPPLLWALAEPRFRAGQFRAAAALLERLVQLGRSGVYDHSQRFDPRIIGPWALLNLGQCFRGLGEPDNARPCFELLLQDSDFAEQAGRYLKEIEAPG
jgi:hypothetical protein